MQDNENEEERIQRSETARRHRHVCVKHRTEATSSKKQDVANVRETREEENQAEPCPTSSKSSQSSIKTSQSIETEEISWPDKYLPYFNSDQFIISPNSKTAYYWMGIVTAVVMYNCASIIVRLTFTELRDGNVYQNVFFFLDLIGDAVYLADCIFQSRVGYLEDGCLVREPAKLLRHYQGQPTFVLDMVSILPLNTVCWTIAGCLHFLPSFMCMFMLDTNVFCGPLLRASRLVKFYTVSKFFDAIDSHTNMPNLMRALKLCVCLWMVIHWIGCIYYMVSEYEGLGANEWVFPDAEDYQYLTRKYIVSMYWSTMTLTTIGERPSPVTDLEYVFTGITFLIGVFVFAAVVGNVGDVISNLYAARQDFQSRMDQIKFYLQHRNVPEELQDKVKKWADYTWNRTKAIDEMNILHMLPERLRTEIAMQVHLKTLKKVKIFEECEEGLLRELVLKLRPQIYSPGDYICRIGEIGRQMYILNHGRVEILVPGVDDDHKTQVAILSPGNYFGEISLLKLDDGQNRRLADVRSIGFSELLCLSRRDLLSALSEYPNAKEILEAQAKERILETKGVTHSDTNLKKQKSMTSRSARDVFTEVMKQEGFSKLLSARGHEMNELRRVVSELRSFVTQSPPTHGATSQCECEALKRTLRRRDQLLEKTKKRVTELETVLRIHKTASLENFSPMNSGTSLNNNHHGVRERILSVTSHGGQRAVTFNQNVHKTGASQLITNGAIVKDGDSGNRNHADLSVEKQDDGPTRSERRLLEALDVVVRDSISFQACGSSSDSSSESDDDQ